MRSDWISLHGHSYYSLLDGISSPKKLAKKAANLGMPALALSDHGSISGAVVQEKEFKEYGVKPIRAVEFYIKDPEFERSTHLVTIAKNISGYKQLLKMVSLSNRPDNFYRTPRLTREQFAELCDGNIIVLNGHCGTSLANILFTDINKAYNSKNYEECASYLYPDAKQKAARLALEWASIVGKDNFFVEIQKIDELRFVAAKVISDVLREVANTYKLRKVATCDFHYADQNDAADQRVILCKYLGKSMATAMKAAADDEDFSLGGFFKSEKYYLPSPEEMYEVHKDCEDEIANSVLINDMIEEYSIQGPPKVPFIYGPNGEHPDEYLQQFLASGWESKLSHLNKSNANIYKERLRYELDTLLPLNLSSYFLIVRDYIEWARNKGCYIGKARGSAGGCLTSYLLGIIGIDPIPPDLKFERFFNAGRKNEYPDIDVDFEKSFRPEVIQYIHDTYGSENTCGIVTFSRLQGAGALKVVLNAHDAANFNLQNRMTEHIPQDAAISDDLQEMVDRGEDPSVIMWALENNAKGLEEWVRLNDDGSLSGEYAEYFEQAIRLEGCRSGKSKHASGYIISSEPISNLAPMVLDKSSDNLICGYDHVSAASCGLNKFDILSTAVLDKLHYTVDLLARSYEED